MMIVSHLLCFAMGAIMAVIVMCIVQTSDGGDDIASAFEDDLE